MPFEFPQDKVKRFIKETVSVFDRNTKECICRSCTQHKLTPLITLQTRLYEIYDEMEIELPYMFMSYYKPARNIRQVPNFSSNYTSILLNIIPIFTDILNTERIETMCECCGKINIKYKNGTIACEDCCDKYYYICRECGSYSNELVSMCLDNDNVYMCVDCLNSTPFKDCSFCTNHTRATSITKPDCGWKGFNSFYNVTPLRDADTFMCNLCAEDIAFEHCHSCGKLSYTQGGLCGRCYIFNVPVHQYNFKPPVVFHRLDTEGAHRDDSLYFGLELEYENKGLRRTRDSVSNIIRQVFTKDDVAYAVHDGSLQSRDQGLELVAMPFTLSYFESIKGEWSEAFAKVKACGFAGDGEPAAGCHIHMSKGAFHTHHLYKFNKFIFDYMNRGFILQISNRVDQENQEYWSFDSQRYDSLKKVAKYRINKKVEEVEYNYRRTAVNVTKNTVELRFFQSTAKLSVLEHYLDFCMMLYRFTRDHALSQCTKTEVCRYIRKKQDVYPHLYDFLVNNRRFKLLNSKLYNILTKESV